MLYSLFIYQSQSGLLLWSKSFEKDIDAQRIELFSSFFSAIQSFVKEMITSGSRNLKNIEMGNFIVKITNLTKFELDIVMIADKDDEKVLSRIAPKIIKVLESHQQIFNDWDGDRSRFEVLDLEILQEIQAERGLFGSKSLIDGHGEIIASIFDNMPELEKSQKENYEKERVFLYDRLKNTNNLLKKLEILNSVEMLDQKLKDKHDYESVQQLKKKMQAELVQTKEKMVYFLSHAKSAVSKAVEFIGSRSFKDLDLRDAYLNIYSFSTKLKIIGRDDLSEEYKAIAQMLIDKEKESEIPSALTKILNLPDDPNSYFLKT
jgi:hypothetical protein